MGDSVPGGYFIGRPANKAADEQPPQPQAAAAAEPNKPANTHIPGDYFVGTPESLRSQGPTAATEPAQPAGQLKRSRSFMEWFPCLRGGQVAN